MPTEVTMWIDKAGNHYPTKGAATKGDLKYDLLQALPASVRPDFVDILIEHWTPIKAVLKEYKQA